MLRHSKEKATFLASNCCYSHRSVRSQPPPSLRVVPPSFEHDLVLLLTLIRGGGGSQAQDHGEAV